MTEKELIMEDIKLAQDLSKKGQPNSKKLAYILLKESLYQYRFHKEFTYLKAKKVLYSLFDEESLALLKEYNKYIRKQVKNIVTEGPWGYSDIDGDFVYYDNFQNMHDHEFRTFDTYRVIRTKEGYEPYDKKPFNYYFQRLLERELVFLQDHSEELYGLHTVLTLKEEFFDGNFRLKDENDRELAMKLINFLDFRIVNKDFRNLPKSCESESETTEFTK